MLLDPPMESFKWIVFLLRNINGIEVFQHYIQNLNKLIRMQGVALRPRVDIKKDI